MSSAVLQNWVGEFSFPGGGSVTRALFNVTARTPVWKHGPIVTEAPLGELPSKLVNR